MAVQNGLSIQKNNGEEDFFDSLKNAGLQDDEPYIHSSSTSKNFRSELFYNDYNRKSIKDTMSKDRMNTLLRAYISRSNQKATIMYDGNLLFETLADTSKNAEAINNLLLDVTQQLNETVQQFSQKQQQGIDTKNYQENLNTAKENAYAAFSVKDGQTKMSQDTLNDFLDRINQAIDMVYGVNASKESDWQTFLTAYQSKILKRKKPNGSYLNFSPAGAEKFKKIAQYLDTMANKYLGASRKKKNGVYSTQSISGSLSNILYRALGEVGLGNSSKKVVSQCLVKINEQIKELGPVGITPVGTDIRPGQSVSQKTDYTIQLPDGSVIRARAKEGDGKIEITGELSISAKWSAGFELPKNDNNDATNTKANISLETSGSAYKQMVDVDKFSPYVAANSLVFNKSESQRIAPYISKYKRYLLRKNIVDYLAGRSTETGGTVLLMCINGYYYPIYSLLYTYLNWALEHKDYEKNGLIYIKIEGTVNNTYKGISSTDNIEKAIQRSRRAFQEINNFVIQIKLRGQMMGHLLKNNLEKQGIEPIDI